ncbi:MAG TPA: NosD domain-containing protein [Anaerohalosphaeraceae bacterium]|nr:NosD domain-containing protein [Anaerohalosphaeraceae bacterium]
MSQLQPKDRLCQLYIVAALLPVVLVAAKSATAATYYVSTTGNDMSGNGTLAKPWRTIQKGQSHLQPGDTLLIRGGRYNESVDLTVQGTEANPITLRAFPGEVPILDGTEPVTGWERCQNGDTSLIVQGVINPYWSNIYRLRIHASRLPKDPSKFMLFEAGAHLRLARDPDQVLGYGLDASLFYPLTSSSYGLTEFLFDDGVGRPTSRPDNYWIGAWIDIHSHAANNVIVRRTIAGNSQADHTISFDVPLSQPISYGSVPDSYSMANHPHVLDSPGEFFHTLTADEDGYYTFYLWPKDEDHLSSEITIASKERGISVRFRSYVIIDGLVIAGYVNEGITAYEYDPDYIDGIVVRNCTIEDCGNSGVSIRRARDSVVEDCIVRRVGQFGIYMARGSNGTIQRCDVKDSERTNIYMATMERSRLLHNVCRGSSGVHGNGMAVYIDSKTILIAYNYFQNSNLALQSIQDVVVYANVVEEACSLWPDDSGPTHGYHVYLHNTLMSSISLNNNAENVPYPNYVIFNNVLSGLNGFDKREFRERSHNIWKAYGWRQTAANGWSLGAGEVDARSVSYEDLFLPLGADNAPYTLPPGSLMIGAGKNIQGILSDASISASGRCISEDFPDFDFTRDAAGKVWKNPPSVGAYEYQPGGVDQSPVALIDQPSSNVVIPYDQRTTIILDGSRSYDPDGGQLVNWIWTDSQGTAIANGKQAIAALAAGPHIITLTVTDDEGRSASRSVSFSVQAPPADNEHPTATMVLEPQMIRVRFNKPVDAASASDPENYTVHGVSPDVLQFDSATNEAIITTSPLTHAETYSVTVANVRDMAGNVMPPTRLTGTYDSGLVGLWRFTEGTGTTTADASGKGHAGRLVGPAWAGYSGLAFDGANDYVEVPDAADLDLRNAFTLGVWVRLNAYDNDWPKLIIKPHTAYDAPWEMYAIDLGRYGNTPRLLISDGAAGGRSAVATNTNCILPLNEWHHIAASYDGAIMTVYVNGKVIATQPADFQIGTNNMPLCIGGRRGVNSFNGYIDDVCVYNRALTAAEIMDLHKPGRQVAHWKFDTYSGPSAADVSEYASAGALTNGPLWTGYGQLRFDGVNDSVDCGAEAHLNQKSSLTLCAWICPESFGLKGDARIVDKGNESAGFAFYLKGGIRGLAWKAGNAEVTSAEDAIRLNEWQHVAVSYSDASDTVTFYVNGKAKGTVTGYTTNPADSADVPLIIGNNAALAAGFKGMISDVRLYSRALTAEEIDLIYRTYEVRENKLVAFEVAADGYTYALQAGQTLPAGATFADGVFSWRPWYNQAGNYTFHFDVAGQAGLTQSIPVVVENVILNDWYRIWLDLLGK